MFQEPKRPVSALSRDSKTAMVAVGQVVRPGGRGSRLLEIGLAGRNKREATLFNRRSSCSAVLSQAEYAVVDSVVSAAYVVDEGMKAVSSAFGTMGCLSRS